jgi:hypothetical protein
MPMVRSGPVKRIVIAISLITLPVNAIAQDRCSAILQDGVWEFRQTTDFSRQTSSFLNWFCSQEFQNYQSARDSGGKIGISIEGIPVEIGGYHRETNWKQYSQAACSLQSGAYQYLSNFSSTARQASAVLADAWRACIASPGFYATVTYVDDPTVFTLQLNYMGLSAGDKAKVTDLLTSPATVNCRPAVTAQQPAEVPTGQEKTFLCTRPKDIPATVVLNADRKLTPGSTFNVRVVKSTDLSVYREISSAKVEGRASWISDTIVIKAGANIEIVPKDENPSLVIAAKRLVIEGPFSVNGKGMAGTDGLPQTACPVAGCEWVSGPQEDKSACHNAWIVAGGHPDDKGQPGHPGGKGGTGANVTFRYHSLQGDSGDAQCAVFGGDGGQGGSGGPGRTLIDCSNPGNLRKSGPQGDRGPQGSRGDSGKCVWQQSQ